MSEKVMQYVGARYVPKFADPIEWQENTAYEALTVVMYNNSSYTSKIPVPANVGIPATNEKYWALTGNYNGQIEEYRQETEEVKNKQSELDTKVDQKTADLGTKIEQEISDRSALIYNNNGKADVPLGLSVEGKLSANDGAEISGMLKYGTEEEVNNIKSIAIKNTSDETVHIPTTESLTRRVLLLVGDSWTNSGEYDNPTALKTALENFYDEVYDYGISGAFVNKLGDMCEKAYNDGVRPTEIIAVCGTNNLAWGTKEDIDTLNTGVSKVLNYYPKTPKHYFPNNSKGGNGLHNGWWSNIFDTMCNNKWIVHKESLGLLLGITNFYKDYQHLSDFGLNVFTNYIMNIKEGGTCSGGLLSYLTNNAKDSIEVYDAYGNSIAVTSCSIHAMIAPDATAHVGIDIVLEQETDYIVVKRKGDHDVGLPCWFAGIGRAMGQSGLYPEPIVFTCIDEELTARRQTAGTNFNFFTATSTYYL